MPPLSFSAYGTILHLPDGDMILGAGTNIQIFPSGNMITISAPTPANVVLNNSTAYQPPQISDAKAPNGSIYYSTDAGKLVFKGYDSAIHNLY